MDFELENNKVNIFVYDTTKAFGRFVRQHFGEEYNIEVCSRSNDLKSYDLSKFHIGFFVQNENKDLISFLLIYENIKSLFIGSSSSENIKIFKELENVVVFDIQETKNEILDNLKFNLKLFSLQLQS